MQTVVDKLLGLPPWWVLAAVFTLPALEASTFVGLVIPGETVVVIGGVAANGGAVPLWAVMVAAAVGACCGDQLGFAIGHRYGQRLLDRVPRRLQRPREVARALDLIRRRGAAAVVLGRWAAALRVLVPGAAGMSGMGRSRFTVANVVGGSTWAVAMAAAGYAAGASYRQLETRIGLAGTIITAVLVVAVAATVLIRRHRS
jgi:membrane protein DedA with SNARE-associated domain